MVSLASDVIEADGYYYYLFFLFLLFIQQDLSGS